MEILFADILKSIGVGFLVGAAIGLTGIGGGVLVMPCLIYILRIAPVPAVGTGLLLSLFAKITGIIEHHRLRNIHIKTALLFTIGSAPASFLSSHLVNHFSISGKFPGLDSFLQYVMGSSMIIAAILLVMQNALTRDRRKERESKKEREEIGMQAISRLTEFTNRRKAGCILVGILVGSLIGATSIGGGVVVIPILMVFFGLNPATTVGTSILISIIPAVLAGTVYALGQNINLAVLIPMVLACFPATVLGSRLTKKLPQRVLRTILMIAVFVAIISFFWGACH